MNESLHNEIKRLMREEGIWAKMINFKAYSIKELYSEIGINFFSKKLQELLNTNVNAVQVYLDERIIEPKKEMSIKIDNDVYGYSIPKNQQSLNNDEYNPF